VRHPLYAFSLVYFAATVLLLGSWFGLHFSTLLMALIIMRTTLEDRTLRRGSPGTPGP
jgi:protein-S-isoprenylcysteine O-methyltransferase Ste14